jgi:hypothetical protein
MEWAVPGFRACFRAAAMALRINFPLTQFTVGLSRAQHFSHLMYIATILLSTPYITPRHTTKNKGTPLKLICKLSRAALAIAGCLGFHIVAQAGDAPAGLLTTDHPNVKAVIAVQKGVTPDLMRLPGVLGTAVGLDDAGQAALVIYVDRDSPARADIVGALPRRFAASG